MFRDVSYLGPRPQPAMSVTACDWLTEISEHCDWTRLSREADPQQRGNG
jgi:hypothetical protein